MAERPALEAASVCPRAQIMENSGKQGNPLGMIVNAVRGKSRVNGKRHVQESCMKVVVSGCIFEGQGAFDLRKNYWSTGKAALNRSYLRQSRSQT
jgi:hypothetical protein